LDAQISYALFQLLIDPKNNNNNKKSVEIAKEGSQILME